MLELELCKYHAELFPIVPFSLEDICQLILVVLNLGTGTVKVDSD